MAPTKQTSADLRKIIINHYKNGKSQYEIAKIIFKPRTTIQGIINRYKKDGSIENKRKKSQKKIFNDADEHWLVRKIKINPMMSAPKLAVEAEKYLGKAANAETIRRILRKHDLHGRIVRKKPFVSMKNVAKRKQFVKDYQDKDFEFWKTVIFSDESKYNIYGSDGRVNVWRKANQELNKKNMRGTVKFGGGSVMVWGCMSAAGVGSLHFIEGTMDRMMYLNILKNNLKQSAVKLGLSDNNHFYQDNDPKHTAAIVQEWLQRNCPNVIKTPAQSPDLNVIENLWHILEVNIRKHTITDKESLKMALQEEWAKISVNYTEKLVRSIPRRLAAVKKNKGLPTKY